MDEKTLPDPASPSSAEDCAPHRTSNHEVQPPQWISVRERYPEVGQDVVYFFELCGTFVGKYLGEHCFAGEAGFLTDDVTHWLPYSKPKRRAVETTACVETGIWDADNEPCEPFSARPQP